MPKKTKVEKEKENKAKARVEQLLDGIELKTNDKKKVTDRVALLETQKGDSWLEEQFDAVTVENEKLKTELSNAKKEATQAKDDYKKLYESKVSGNAPAAAPTNAPSIGGQKISKLKALLVEMDNQMRGRNKSKTPNPDVRVAYVINKLVEIFPEVK